MNPCPACGGQHLYALTYRHAASCRIYQRDDAIVAADHYNRTGTRPARAHEKELITGDYEAPGEGLDYGITFEHAGGVHWRLVVLLNSDGEYVADAHLPGEDDGGDDPDPAA